MIKEILKGMDRIIKSAAGREAIHTFSDIFTGPRFLAEFLSENPGEHNYQEEAEMYLSHKKSHQTWKT